VSVASVIGAGAALVLLLLARAGLHGSPEPSAIAVPGAATADESSATPPPLAPPLPSDSVPLASGEARPPTDAPPKRAPILPVHRRSGCTPPYTIDARGVRHYKPECL
jgi:serine/threonine-protein kinase